MTRSLKRQDFLIEFTLYNFFTDSNNFFQLMTNTFRFLTHTKIAKVVLSGEPGHFMLFGLLLKGFLFFILYFSKKRRILQIIPVYINKK